MGRRGPVFCVIQRDDVLTLPGAASGCQLRAAARADMPRAGFNTLTRKSSTKTLGSSRLEAKAGRRGGVPGDGGIGRGLTWARLTPSRSASIRPGAIRNSRRMGVGLPMRTTPKAGNPRRG
jgi:hypothetical protein